MPKRQNANSHMHQLGLIGYPLTHSFSKKYFSDKFEKEGIPGFHYELYAIEQITDLPKLLHDNSSIKGLNVTIPYKQAVLPYLDEIDEAAAEVGAVNTIKIQDGKLKGYNTDIYGFEISLLNQLSKSTIPLTETKALILGTGGAAKAVRYVLDKVGIFHQFVSRKKQKEYITYDSLTPAKFKDYQLVINTTPLGMSPNYETCPDLPYEATTDQHYFYDLVYNPAETLFLKKGAQQGASIKNGLEMLILQAEKSWSIWTMENQ